MNWHDAVELVLPHVVRITTPSGHGTGFLRNYYGDDSPVVSFATAAHVVRQAYEWDQPIRLHHKNFPNGSITLPSDKRDVYIHSSLDVAAVIATLPTDYRKVLPDAPIQVVPRPGFVKRGVAIGWLGYPYLVGNGTECCFFSGSVSAFVERYFIDGVAIEGVSGGPAFLASGKKLVIIGCISRYMPNIAGGDTALPGLLVVENVADLVLDNES